MPNHDSHRRWLPLILLAVACNQGEEAAGGEQPDRGTSTTGASSTSTSGPDVPTTTIPTTAADSSGGGSTGTETSSTGSTSTGEEPVDSSSSTTDLSPTCGDAKLDPGEECDLGFGENDDHQGACTLGCKLATCGDGLIRAGKEACDNGPNNNNELYGGCTTSCQFGDHCNDGIVQGPEECDLGAENGTDEFLADSVPCDNGCRYHARLVFLSSTTYKGGEVGGVEGAHLKCKALADKAGFDNSASFMAWISDAQHSPAQDFKHDIDTVDLPYVLPNGVRVADDWTDLVLNGPGDGIVIAETGEILITQGAWTGTAPSGKVFDPAAHCKAWSSSSPADKSRLGLSGVDKQQFPQKWADWNTGMQWTNYLSAGCNSLFHLYCFEQ